MTEFERKIELKEEKEDLKIKDNQTHRILEVSFTEKR
jgi:hypothetical protein